MYKTMIIGVIIVLTVMSGGCATYKTYSLPTSDIYNLSNRQEKGGVIVGIKFFEPRELKAIFGTNTLKKGIEPVYIIIDNKSSNTYIFSRRRINRTIIPVDIVVQRCGFHTLARASRWGIPGAVLWPLLVPAVIDGISSSETNKKMASDYEYKEIKDGRIFPGTVLNGCVFIDTIKSGEEFNIRIQDIEDNEILLFSFVK